MFYGRWRDPEDQVYEVNIGKEGEETGCRGKVEHLFERPRQHWRKMPSAFVDFEELRLSHVKNDIRITQW